AGPNTSPDARRASIEYATRPAAPVTATRTVLDMGEAPEVGSGLRGPTVVFLGVRPSRLPSSSGSCGRDGRAPSNRPALDRCPAGHTLSVATPEYSGYQGDGAVRLVADG